MREIKFRGKHIHSLDINKKLDGIWVYGYLCGENYIWSDKFCGDMLVDKNTIGQYTGLKDKNGVEIYEGDIIKTNFEKQFLVKWIPRIASFCYVEICKNVEGKYYLSKELQAGSYEVEVIGNIYDNKELLKKEGK